jgi:flagellar protein FliO/FliZ
MDAAILISFIKMLFALAIVLGLMMGAVYLVKRYVPQNPGGWKDKSIINIVASRYLGPKNSIMLVEILGKVIVIGVSSTQISHLATISEMEALDKLKHLSIQEQNAPPFLNHLTSNKILLDVLNRFGKHGRKK